MKIPLRHLAALLLAAPLGATEWPQDYEVVKGTASPDGRYGILAAKIPSGESGMGEDANGFFAELEVNYLADLKKHQVIAPISEVAYPDMAHGGLLTVEWAKDDSWCVACYGGKWGFRTIRLLQLDDGKATETDLGSRIQVEADKITKAFLTVACVPIEDGGLKISAAGSDNPRELADVTSHYVAFEGSFSLSSGGWSAAHAKAISKAEYQALGPAAQTVAKPAQTPPPTRDAVQEARRTRLDAELNKVYQELKAALPADKFTTVQNEQRDWIASAGKAGSPAAENDRTQMRVESLRKLLAGAARADPQEARRERLDAELNAVYHDLKAAYPADKFATVVAEQREWLDGAGKATDLAAENTRTEARVKALRNLLKAAKK